MTPEEIFQILKDKFTDSILEFENELPTEPFIKVDALELNKICEFLRDD